MENAPVPQFGARCWSGDIIRWATLNTSLNLLRLNLKIIRTKVPGLWGKESWYRVQECEREVTLLETNTTIIIGITGANKIGRTEYKHSSNMRNTTVFMLAIHIVGQRS